MKKILIALLVPFILLGCFTYKTLDIARLRTGMNKVQVEKVAGLPERLLILNETHDGVQEVYQYRTSYNEVYALEFWDDYLTGFEFLYDDMPYVPSPMPPAYYPDYGRPILPPDYVKPNRPNKPNKPDRPNRPEPPVRPTPPSNSEGAGTSRPSMTRPTERPSQPAERPSQPDQSTRPTGGGRR